MGIALSAVGEILEAGGVRFEIVVIGGAALQILGLVDRPTADVDVLAIVDRGRLQPADPLPTRLSDAARRAAADFGLADDWLNAGPAGMVRWGLPDGFLARTTTRTYGALTIHFASRFDQIHFKLFAFADQGGGRHEADLRALTPTHDELVTAATWARTQDPSPGFRDVLAEALRQMEVDDDPLD